VRTPLTKIRVLAAAIAAALVVPALASASSASTVRKIVFPVIGPVRFSNDFGAPRVGHTHEGNDLMGSKMQPLVAAVSGRVSLITVPQRSWGYAVFIRDSAGYEYRYIHMNNDTPGTDDGMGTPMQAFAPDIAYGNRVAAGQLLGWMGDSGNAEWTAPHLHFEIRAPDGTAINPYDSLMVAPRLPAPVATHPRIGDEILPYGTFDRGTNVAAGNLDSDSSVEIVTGAGPGGGPHVRTFDSNGTPRASFFAYHPAFAGGVDVATGDVDGDGIDEIITSPGRTGGPHIRVFRANGKPMSGGFMAYSPTFTGGVRVAAADLDRDGRDEIVTGPGPGGGPHVRTFEWNGKSLGRGFMAYAPAFTGGIDVAAGNVEGGITAEIVTAAGRGGGPHVAIFRPRGRPVDGFFVYNSGFTGGVKVSVGNVRTSTSHEEIVTGPGVTGGPHVRVLTHDGTELSTGFPFEPWWTGGIDVAAGTGKSFAAAGAGRRASVRRGPR
jgi:hypothetical protein